MEDPTITCKWLYTRKLSKSKKASNDLEHNQGHCDLISSYDCHKKASLPMWKDCPMLFLRYAMHPIQSEGCLVIRTKYCCILTPEWHFNTTKCLGNYDLSTVHTFRGIEKYFSMFISIKTINFQTSQKSSFLFQFQMKWPKNSFAEPICMPTQNFRTSICYWVNMDDYFFVFSHSLINFQKITKSTCLRMHFGKMTLKWHRFYKNVFEH